MTAPERTGIPAVRGPLAATAFRAPTVDERVTIVPDLPLVPVRGVVAAVLAADPADRDTVWVDLPTDDAPLWEALRHGLAAIATSPLKGDPQGAVSVYLAALKSPLLLALTVPPTVPHEVDAILLEILRDAPLLSVLAISPARRPLEVLGRVEFGARVVHGGELVLDGPGIRAFSAKLGVDLTEQDADALAASPLLLPDVLPAVIASASLEEIETQGDAVGYLLDEAESYLTMRFRATADESVRSLLPLAVPSTLTSEILGLVAPTIAARSQLDRIAQARIVLREPGKGEARYRIEPMLRRVLILELRYRDPALAKKLSDALGVYFRDRGDVFESIAHFSDAEDWDAVIDTLDGEMFRLLAEDPLRVHDAILALPRTVRDAHPRLSLCLEVGWQPREGLMQAYLTIARRAAGIFGRLPAEMSTWDRLHVHLIQTIVFRLKGDFTVALHAADALDRLLEEDPEIAAKPLGTLSEAHYQSGMTRLLGLDLVGAREGFAKSFTLAQNRGADAGVRLADRAAEATALVRALESETESASEWLALVENPEPGVAGVLTRALVAIGRSDALEASEWMRPLVAPMALDELWPFAVHATARYGLFWGDPVETDAVLDRAWADHGEQLVAGSTGQALLTADAADLALLLGQLSRAEQALDAVASRTTWIAVPRARMALLGSNPKHALLFILEGQRRGRTERHGQLDLAVLRSVAELALGRQEDATASLLRAINSAEKAGVTAPFQLLPRETLAQLAGLHTEAAQFIDRHGITGTSFLAPYQTVAGALSERELIVLRSLEPGETVEQIAKKLYVASNTVKAQLRSIYRKLGVSTRTEALLVAAELGLLDDAKNSRSA